jgi:MFS family permease
MEAATAGETITTRIPGRMDRLPWSRWHWLVILGLGTVWVLDGVEVTIVGAIASRLQDKQTLALSAFDIAFGGTCYIIGAAIGAIGFGYLTDRLGRKRLFIITLAVYLAATVATAFTWSAASFWIFRMLTGLGIGGEYAAINSAIDELIPARARGWVDLAINGSYWLGASAGAALSFVLLDESLFAINLGWRLAFGLGAAMGLAIMFVRRNVPESPRWLIIHGREDEAEKLVGSIEERVKHDTGVRELDDPGDEIEIEPRKATNVIEVGRTLFKRYPRRSILGFTLMATQAFIYNAVIFTFSIVLTTFFKVSDSAAPAYLIPFGIANFAGALLLGRLFDTVGRKPMIAGTYLGSAAVAALLAVLFTGHALGSSAWTFQVFIFATFFLASAGASAAYLTVSEIFPMETRALAIAFFFAVGTAIGGIIGPLLFANMIASGNRGEVATAFLIGAAVMAVGGIVEIFFGVKAEQEPLEDIATPLTAEEAEHMPERERGGRRRYRPGPGIEYPYYSPGFMGTSLRRPTAVAELQHEVEAIGRAVDEGGQVSRDELFRMVGGRRWGPGRFRRALDEAVAAGRIRRTSRGRYEAPEPGA